MVDVDPFNEVSCEVVNCVKRCWKNMVQDYLYEGMLTNLNFLEHLG